jgi:hypothetical protein
MITRRFGAFTAATTAVATTSAAIAMAAEPRLSELECDIGCLHSR